MEKVNILIVEDELIVAEYLKDILTAQGHNVVFIALNAIEAFAAIIEYNPDLLLLDILIQGEKDGIELAKVLQKNYDVPFIFITAHADKATLSRAKEVCPYGYIVKPFREQDIEAAIQIAISNFHLRQANRSTPVVDDAEMNTWNESLFIPDRGRLQKVRFKDILWLEADGNYTSIHTKCVKYAVRKNLKELEDSLPVRQFLRTHKSYIVNLEEVTAINSQFLFIDKVQLPIGRTYYPLLLSKLNISNLSRIIQ